MAVEIHQEKPVQPPLVVLLPGAVEWDRNDGGVPLTTTCFLTHLAHFVVECDGMGTDLA